MDRTKVLHGPQTQTYGETNCLKSLVLDRIKVLHSPRTQTYGENQLLKGNLGTKLGLTIHMTFRMMPISSLKYVQTPVQRPMGAGKLECRDKILDISYAQTFIHIKIDSS